jgi:hypothetical protein
MFEQLGADRELAGDGQVASPPRAKVRQYRDELDSGFGEAVDDLLLVAWVWGSGDEAVVGEALEPVGEDVRASSDSCSSSLKCRRLPNIMSRMITSDHLSPNTSVARLIGHAPA